jgi:hypothetical protein
LKENKRALKDNKSALKEKYAATWSYIAYLQVIQAGLPIYDFCSLATTLCCTRQSAFLLNQSQNENEIRTFDRLTGIA